MTAAPQFGQRWSDPASARTGAAEDRDGTIWKRIGRNAA